MSGDDPPYLPVGTDVSAKYKGAFCEAKVSKVVRVLQLKVTYNGPGLGTGTVTDEQVRYPPSSNQPALSGALPLRVGHTVQVKHPEKKEYVSATITRIRDCSQYTVVFDDGDITTLRRTALCLKSGRHFNESETLDQLPLTHPEHFGNPVVGGRRGRRSRQLKEDSSDADGEDAEDMDVAGDKTVGTSSNASNIGRDVGKVVCVEMGEGKRKGSRDSNWFPGLVVAPTAQAAVRINTRDECLIRSFRDGRYYTVPRKEITEFKREGGTRVESPTLAEAVDKALNYLDHAELPQHWDKDTLFGLHMADYESDGNYSDSSDDEPREEKDHFVAQLYKFMDDRGTPLNKGPVICNKDVDLCRMFRIVHKLGGYNSVTNKNKWRIVTARLGFTKNSATTLNLVKQAYYRFLFPFEEFNRKLGCTMVPHPRNVKKNKGRNLIRDRDRATPVQTTASPKPDFKTEDSNDTVSSEKDKKEDVPEKEETSKRKIKHKEEPVVKIRKEPDVIDTSSSEGTVDIMNDPPPAPVKKNVSEPSTSTPKGVKKLADNKTSHGPAAKRSKVANIVGEKVKALVEKFEEQARLQEKEEDKVQQTRSKSGVRKDSNASSPDRKPREPRVPPQESSKSSNNSTSKPQRTSRPSADEEKKRGRKRKDAEEKTQSSDSSVSDPPSTIITNVNVGDKLKVYYGPNIDSKVTYEAKVLEIEHDDTGRVYLVHYTGWNNRYDEWIKPHRIAENISQSTKGKRPSKTTTKPPSSHAQSQVVGKRGRGASISSRNANSSSQDSQTAPPSQARSTTPSSVTSSSSRTKSPATPAARAPSARLAKQAENIGKRSGSTTGNTSSARHLSTASDTESGTSDAEDAPKRRAIKRKEETPERVLTEEEGPTERPKRARKTPKKNANESVVTTSKVTPQSSPSDSVEPKGRDYDLNQIRSELKGFEKALKIAPPNTNADTETLAKTIIETKVVLNKTIIPDEPKKVEKTPEKEIKELKPNTDDIYEFKEPEPLELETRSSKLCEDKPTKKRRLLEDLDKPVITVEKLTPTKKKTPTRTPPKSEIKSPESTEKKSRFRRNLTRKSEDPESSPSPGSKSPATGSIKTEVSVPPEKGTPRSRTVSASEEAFDKLVVSPSFNINLKSSPRSTAASPTPSDKHIEKYELSDHTPAVKNEDSDEEKVTEMETVVECIKDEPSSLDNSEEEDEDDPIHMAIRGITESKDDDDSSDQLLINQPFTSINTSIIETNAESHPAIESCKPNIKTETPIVDIPSETIPSPSNEASKAVITKPVITKSTVEPSPSQHTTSKLPEPLTIKTEKVTTQTKKDEKCNKQISPALQETDSSLLEAAISQQTTDLPTIENIYIPKRTGPRIAGSILQKFDAIKKKEENPVIKPVEVPVKEELEISAAVLQTPIVPLNVEVPEKAVSPVSTQDSKRLTNKRALSREFIDSDDSDSSDSEERLIIARSDDDSQLSQGDDSFASNVNTEKISESVKDTDSNNSALRINTEESSQDSKPKNYAFESSLIDLKLKSEEAVKTETVKAEEEPDSNISLLLCEETIPGSPAPVTEVNVSSNQDNRIKPKSAKSLVLEMPFASAPGTSKTLISEQLKHGSMKSTIDLKPVCNTQQNVSNVPVTIATASTNTHDSSSSASLNINNVLNIKDDLEEANPTVDNSSPTTPESSISNLSPRGEHGGSSPGTADESNKSQRGSETSEVEPYSSSRLNKPHHYSEEDTLLASDNTTLDVRSKKSSPRSNNDESLPSTPSNTTITTGNPTCRKRRRSFKGDDIVVNPPPVANKRGRKPNALKNIRTLPVSVVSAVNSDSDDNSEHSSATSATNTIPLGPGSGSNAGTESRLQMPQSMHHRSSKYNFIVELDPNHDSGQRIALLQQKMSDLRKAYCNEKNELASIERRLKKIRRREREALKAAKQEVACS